MATKDVYEFVAKANAEILAHSVKRIAKADLIGLMQFAEAAENRGELTSAMMTYKEIVRVLCEATVHLEKQNLLMENDYKRKGMGR